MKTHCRSYFAILLVSSFLVNVQAAEYITFTWIQSGLAEPVEYEAVGGGITTDPSQAVQVSGQPKLYPYPMLSRGEIRLNKDLYDFSFGGSVDFDINNFGDIASFWFEEYRGDGTHSIIWDSSDLVVDLTEEVPLTGTLLNGEITSLDGRYSQYILGTVYVGFGHGMPTYDSINYVYVPNPEGDPEQVFTGYGDPLFHGTWRPTVPEAGATFPLLMLSALVLLLAPRYRGRLAEGAN